MRGKARRARRAGTRPRARLRSGLHGLARIQVCGRGREERDHVAAPVPRQQTKALCCKVGRRVFFSSIDGYVTMS